MNDAYQVRGPNDGDWFVVLVDGDDETAIDEVFQSQELAQVAADRLNRDAWLDDDDTTAEDWRSEMIYWGV